MDRPHARTLSIPDRFQDRHIGPGPADRDSMLEALGAASLEEMMDAAVPGSLRSKTPLTLPPALTEQDCLAELRSFADQNELWRSYLGMGYSATSVPPAIQRNILENPGWYTQYTPYQAEISQGRLEALLIFQTMIADLSGLEVAGSSLLDEATAAAEAMTLCKRALGRRSADRNVFFADHNCHPQTLAVLATRAEALGIEVVVGDCASQSFGDDCFGALVQYPGSNGEIPDLSPIADRVHSAGALLCVATDLLALTMLEAPGALGADVVVGSAQRFGVPMGYGGPHAGFLAGREAHKRMLPGRIVGVSIDRNEKAALRLALATREQHIRREKATSNICTAQVLLAIMAGMYAVYHGPERLRAIASRVHDATSRLATALRDAGLEVVNRRYFDTLTLRVADGSAIRTRAKAKAINLRYTEKEGSCLVGISLDETVRFEDLVDLAEVLGASPDALPQEAADESSEQAQGIPPELQRKSPFLTHPVFDRYHSETELMRYLHHLQEKDLSLTSSMIPLGSCTMKLNAAAELVPLSWPEFANLHPFAPKEQAKGYATLIERLSSLLSKITGFAATSLQPNAGSQGEYSGLLVIRAWQRSRGQEQRKVCLIPSSAHGTNPASATLAGLEVHVVGCDKHGNIDVEDLRAKAKQFEESLAALMVTYPSTHGVFEESIREVCEIVHQHGGQVYMDGANMNAQVGYLSPGDLGADVCHLNLHKTFAIPHGGGGPGVGPICVAEHLVPFLPGHPLADCGGEMSISAISAAPYGSPLVLPISYAYIRMMGAEGLRDATAYSILGANYIAKRLASRFPVLYSAKNGYVAHECILDLRPLEKESGVSVGDVSKRLMDYSFHAPTMSFPVAGTLMVEPTESESLRELDRFIEAMTCIREEIQEIVDGKSDAKDNLLKNAPHSAKELCGNDWTHPYSRERAGFPTEASRRQKFWPPVARVNDVYGDRTLVSRCEEGLWG